MKIISPKILIGNAILEIPYELLSRESIEYFIRLSEEALEEKGYKSKHELSFSFEEFCEEYPFLLKKVDDVLAFCEKTEEYIAKVERLCRIGIPCDVVEVFRLSGKKISAEFISQKDSEQFSAEDLSACYEEQGKKCQLK